MTDLKIEQAENDLEQEEGSGSTEPQSTQREPSDYERRLKRDLSRTKEQLRVMQSEKEKNTASLLQEREAAILAIRAETNSKIIASELRAQALKAGIIDLDGLRLVDASSLSVDTDGAIVGAEALIEKLRHDKSYLFGESRSGLVGGTTGQTQRAPAPAAPAALDARTMSRETWQAERDRLLSRHNPG